MSAPDPRIAKHVKAISDILCELYPGLKLHPPLIKAGPDWPLAPLVLISGDWSSESKADA